MAAGGAGEDRCVVIDVPHINDNVSEASQTFATFICCQDNKTPHGPLLAVQGPLGIDLACDFINYELTLCTLSVERVTQGLLVSIFVRVRRCYL